jgi:hypothetical protein
VTAAEGGIIISLMQPAELSANMAKIGCVHLDHANDDGTIVSSSEQKSETLWRIAEC